MSVFRHLSARSIRIRRPLEEASCRHGAGLDCGSVAGRCSPCVMRPSNWGFESRTRRTPVSDVSQWMACKSAVVMRLEDIAARDGVEKSVTHGTGPLQGARPSLQQTSNIHLAACPLLSQKQAADPRPSPLWSSPSSQVLSSLSSPPSELSSATPTQPSSVVGWPVVQEFGRGSMFGVALSLSLFHTLLSNTRPHESTRQLTTKCLHHHN